jgi:hypothetical protein
VQLSQLGHLACVAGQVERVRVVHRRGARRARRRAGPRAVHERATDATVLEEWAVTFRASP